MLEKRSKHTILDGSLCAASTRTPQEDIIYVMTILSIKLHQTSSSSLARAKGVVEVKDIEYEYVYGKKESFNTNIQNLIVKWEERGGEGGGVEGGEGGSTIGRRRSSEFLQKLNSFEQNQKIENPNPNIISFSNINWTHSNNIVSDSESISYSTHRMRGGSLLAEGTTNGKRERDDEMDNPSGTKKLRQK